MLRMVGAHLFGQLTKPLSQLALHSPIRRASVDLIGRGFSVWCEFMNLTAVLMTLVELQTDPTVSLEIKKAIAQSGNIPATGEDGGGWGIEGFRCGLVDRRYFSGLVRGQKGGVCILGSLYIG